MASKASTKIPRDAPGREKDNAWKGAGVTLVENRRLISTKVTQKGKGG